MKLIKFLKNNREIKKTKKQEQKRKEHFSKQVEPLKEICEKHGCQNKIGGIERFKCNYCLKQFCSEHRLPEEHNCQ